MKLLRSWKPFVICLLVTPPALLVGWATSIEGDFFYTKLLFPYSIISTIGFRLLSIPGSDLSASILIGVVFGLSIVQFPIYGVIVSYADETPPFIVKLAGIHVAFSVLAFVLSYWMGI